MPGGNLSCDKGIDFSNCKIKSKFKAKNRNKAHTQAHILEL